jgi:putative chitinase
MLTRDQVNLTVSKMFRGIDKDFVNELARIIIEYQNVFYVNNPHRLAMFLAHVKAEIDVRRDKTVRMRENMNYSAKRLMEVFSFFRHNEALARKYAYNGKAIASIVYANKNGNAEAYTHDGWTYRGLGALQVTFKDTILRCVDIVMEKTGMELYNEHGDLHWEFLETYTGGIFIALAYWYMREMYAAETIDDSTRIINKYTDSYEKRRRYYNKACKILKC